MSWLARNWLLIALALAALAAWLAPSLGARGGPLHPERTVAWAVALSFLASGLALPLATVRAAAARWRLHLFVQGFAFVAVPVVVLALTPLLTLCGAPDAVRTGFVVLACLPTTIATSVLLSRAAGGDEAAALCNAVGGNLLGVVVSPLLIAVLIGRQVDAPVATVIGQLALVVLLPFAVGQAMQAALGARAPRLRPWLRHLPSVCVVFIAWTLFCQTVLGAGTGTVEALLVTVAGVIVLHAVLLGLCWWSSRWSSLRLTRPERIAALFTATHKTMALGAPLVASAFAGDPLIGLYSLPMVLYHPVQIAVAGVIAGRLAKR